jgi:hypothetical protein
MFPVFCKLSVLSTLIGLLRFLNEKIGSKMLILLKKYLKVFYTHRIHFEAETDKYLLEKFLPDEE